MTPELPMPIPAGAVYTSIEFPTMECSMLRLEARCANPTPYAIMFSYDAGYYVLAFCQDCYDDMPPSWRASFDNQAAATLIKERL